MDKTDPLAHQPLAQPTDINTITVAGMTPPESRLVGKVTSIGANSDGRVFFNHLTINITGEMELKPELVRPRAATPRIRLSRHAELLAGRDEWDCDRHVEFPCGRDNAIDGGSQPMSPEG